LSRVAQNVSTSVPRPAHKGESRQRGQALVEFALVLVPLLFIFFGIIQFGLVFNAYVTVANAAREGAREASVYVYDFGLSQAQNDTARAARASTAVTNSMGFLSTSSPNFSVASDVVVNYGGASGCPATSASATDPTREGQNVCVGVTYHLDLFFPLLEGVLPSDGSGRVPLAGQVTMVIN
jgi:Flp pilus assembly protein TadG